MEEDLKKLLDEEAGIKMSDKLFERFLGMMTEQNLKNKEVLIPYGKFDNNIYVQKSGIFRACYFDGGNEKTYGFSNPGSVILSYHAHYMRQPSSFQIESCGESVVLKMSKKQHDDLIESSHEFAKWHIGVLYNQLYYNEFKHAAITGSAKERYIALIQGRPAIQNAVPVKTIASYLGVTPNYLSYLKSVLLEEER